MDLILKTPRLRNFDLPKPGEKFKCRQLPPIAKRLYETLSRISKVPVNELMPIYADFHPQGHNEGGCYDESTHSVSMRTPIKYAVFEEEFIHSLQEFLPRFWNRLKPEEGYRRSSDVGFGEPSAKIFMQEISSRNAFEYYNRSFIGGEGPSEYALDPRYGRISHPIDDGILKKHASKARDWKNMFDVRIALARNFFERHKEEGYLLLFASPPNDLFDLEKWEQNRIRRGILKAQGGITDKGMKLLRRIYSAKNIRNTLDDYIEPEREKMRMELEKRKE